MLQYLPIRALYFGISAWKYSRFGTSFEFRHFSQREILAAPKESSGEKEGICIFRLIKNTKSLIFRKGHFDALRGWRGRGLATQSTLQKESVSFFCSVSLKKIIEGTMQTFYNIQISIVQIQSHTKRKCQIPIKIRFVNSFRRRFNIITGIYITERELFPFVAGNLILYAQSRDHSQQIDAEYFTFENW